MPSRRLLVGLALFATLVVAALVSRSLDAKTAPHSTIDPAKLVDLTYDFDAQTIYWPTAKPFDWQKESWGPSPKGYWYAAARYAASEHGGTHLDSPIHFAQGKETADQIPVSSLVAPVEVIDVSAACAKNPDYVLSASDIQTWEKQHGPVAAGSIFLVHTGWGKYWPDKKAYLGSDTPGDTANLHFPGIGRDAAELLVTRKISGVGIDTASMDHGQSKDFIAHQVFNGAGIYGLENVAYLEKVPATGATLIALPMKIKGGSGAPVRIVALLP